MSKTVTQILDSNRFDQIPAYFIPNFGQTCEQIDFYAQSPTCHAAFTSQGVDFTFLKRLPAHDAISQREEVNQFGISFCFLHARSGVKPKGRVPLPGKVNYFKGNDPACWHRDIPAFQEVVYPELWPGIDLVFRGENGQFKYEFIVQPGANTGDIQFTYRGVKELSLDEEGNLVFETPFGMMRDQRPVSYLQKGEQQLDIPSEFQLVQNKECETVISFNISVKGDFDCPLVIDPGILYSSYLGGSSDDYGLNVAVDSAGNAYITGYTSSVNFPTTQNVFQPSYRGGTADAFLTKVNSSGALVFSTYLGGSGNDVGLAIALDVQGDPYITGYTSSVNFPVSQNAFQISKRGEYDAFVTKFLPDGTPFYSTYIGGSGDDYGQGIAIDIAGNVYLTGLTTSLDFPIRKAFQTEYAGGLYDAFVVMINMASSLEYSSYLGGSGNDYGISIAVDHARNAYITGFTNSSNFRTYNPLQPVLRGNDDAFVTKLDLFGNLIYSTYLGGSRNDSGYAIAVDSAGNAFVTGETSSSDFPTTANAFQSSLHGYYDAFVTKINPTGTLLIYSTYLGGNDYDVGYDIAIDGAGNAYVTGATSSGNFPTTANAFQSFNRGGFNDAYVTKIDPSGSSLIYSSYLGGSGTDYGTSIALDNAGNAYVTGYTSSLDFPLKNAFQTAFRGGAYDAFVTKIGEVAATTPLLGPLVDMEQALAETLRIVNASGDIAAIERILKLIIKKERLLLLLLEESRK